MRFFIFTNFFVFSLSHADNIVLNDSLSEKSVLDSVAQFSSAGGGCLVENSTLGLHRKSHFMKRVTEETGVHVVAGTGQMLFNIEVQFFRAVYSHTSFM